MGKTLVMRAYKYRFVRHEAQQHELPRTFGYVRLVRNKALEARTSVWYREQRRINYVQTSALLAELTKPDGLAFLAKVSSVPLQQCLRHFQSAFANFFAKCAKCPHLKSRDSRGLARKQKYLPKSAWTA